MAFSRKEAISSLGVSEALYNGGLDPDCACSPDVKPMAEHLLETCRRVVDAINSNDHEVIKNVTEIAMAGAYAARHTFKDEKLSDEEIKIMGKIFRFLEQLLDDYLIGARPLIIKSCKDGKIEYCNNEQADEDWTEKLTCILDVFRMNFETCVLTQLLRCPIEKQGWIICNVEHLYKIAKFIEQNWSELRERGYSHEVLQAFYEAIKFQRMSGVVKNEDETMKALMAILYGEQVLVPIVECKVISYAVLERNSKGNDVIYYPGNGQPATIGLKPI